MFIIQSSNLSFAEQAPTLDALDELGIPYTDVGVIPFSDELVNIEDSYDEPVVVLGSCKLVALASSSKYPQLNEAVFFKEENMRVEKWIEEMGSEMLNYDSKKTTFGELLEEPFEDDIFIRPTRDLKQFAGTVVNHAEYVEWFNNNKQRTGNLYTEILEHGEVMAAPAKNIAAEWRVFIVNGKVIDGSRYRLDGQMSWDEDFPWDVKMYALTMSKIWQPHLTYVIDIAMLRDETYKVIEYNCFNASGYYKVDRKKILRAVHEFAKFPWYKSGHDLSRGMVVRCNDDGSEHIISSKKMWGYSLLPVERPENPSKEWWLENGRGFVDVYAIQSYYELVRTDEAYCPTVPHKWAQRPQ